MVLSATRNRTNKGYKEQEGEWSQKKRVSIGFILIGVGVNGSVFPHRTLYHADKGARR